MAIQTVNYVKGKISNVIFYETRNGFYARSAPVKVNQSEATEKRKVNMAIASPASATLRQLLQPVLRFLTEPHSHSRFTGAIAKWLRQSNAAELAAEYDLPFISGFSFSKKTSIADRWKVSFTYTPASPGEIQVHIPAFIPSASVIVPASVSTVECTFVAACCHLLDKKPVAASEVLVNFPCNDSTVPAQALSFPLTADAGCLVVVAVAMRFKSSFGIPNMDAAHLPSSVIGAWYTG